MINLQLKTNIYLISIYFNQGFWGFGAHDPHPSNGYLFFLRDGKTAALIDPAGTRPRSCVAIAEGPYALRYILVTHKHADHCECDGRCRARVSRRADRHAQGRRRPRSARSGRARCRSSTATNCRSATPSQIRMLHTPGHTDGSTCFLFRFHASFSGDTLFAGSVGGAYGDASTYRDTSTASAAKLFALDDATVVMPGHGPPTTIAEKRPTTRSSGSGCTTATSTSL